MGCKSIVSKGWVSGEGTTNGHEAPPQRFMSAFLNSSIWVLRAWFSFSKILTLSSEEVFVFMIVLSKSVITWRAGDYTSFPACLIGEHSTFWGDSDWMGSNTDACWLGDCWLVKFANGEEWFMTSSDGCWSSIFNFCILLLGDGTLRRRGLNFLKYDWDDPRSYSWPPWPWFSSLTLPCLGYLEGESAS